MAFVFKSNKELDKPIQKEYNVCLSQEIYRIKDNDLKKDKTKRIQMLNSSIIKPPILRKQSAFGSDKKRDFLFLKLNQCSPGPGSYELSDNLIKKSFNNNITSMGNDDYYRYDSNIYGFDHQNKSKFFISKEERFKKLKEDNIPGPGNYELTKFQKSVKDASNKMLCLKKSRSYISNSANKRNISIPSKGNNYGYKIDEKGELVLEDDPNLLNNNGKDVVGPGSYDINLPKIQKGILDWSKASTDNKNKRGGNLIKKELFNNIGMLMDDLNNNETNKHNLYNNSKTETETENNNNKEHNQKSNYIDKGINVNSSSKNENFKKNIKEIKINESNYEKNIKNNSYFNINDIDNFSNPDHFNYNFLRMLYDKQYYKKILNKYSLNKSQSPGPGSYYFPDEFDIIANYSKSDNFGSSSSRGLLYEKKENKILIGNKPKTNIEKDKKLRINYSFNKNKSQGDFIKNDYGKIINLNKKINKNKSVENYANLIQNINKNNNIIHKLTTEEKIKINDEYINKIKDKDKDNDSNGKKNINKNSSKIEKFGSLEKRFLEQSPVNVTPGVGTYSLIKSYKNNKDKYKSNSPYNVIIQKINKVNGISEELKNKIYKLNHKIPPIGLYSPELKNCIEYNSAKKSHQKTERKIGFLSEEKRFFKLDNLKDANNDVGKYNLIRDEKEINQQKVPFAFGEDRNNKINIFNYNMGNYTNYKIGPGVYRYDSYFDWHKKSFNKNFI